MTQRLNLPTNALPRRWLMLNYAFLGLLILIVVGLGSWGYFARIEESVTGMGQMVPQGQLRKIMAPRGGIVAEVQVTENQHVRKGDVLVVLDPESSAIESQTAMNELELLRGEANALRSAYAGQASRQGSQSYDAWLMASQQATDGELAVATMQIEEAEHNVQESMTRKKHLGAVLDSSEAMLKQYQALAKEGGLSQNELQSFAQTVEQQRSDMAQLDEEILARTAALTQAEQRPINIQARYQRDLMDRLNTQQRQVVSMAGTVAQNKVTLKEQVIRAPVSGRVNEQAIHEGGEVVQAGSTLLSIVPDNVPLVAEIQVPNRELAYLHVKQRAALRLDALPYQQFGRLFGTITGISPSSVSDNNGQPVFLVRIKPDKTALKRHGHRHSLTSGMTLTADIITRERNLFSFLTEPVEHQLNQAFRDPTTR